MRLLTELLLPLLLACVLVVGQDCTSVEISDGPSDLNDVYEYRSEFDGRSAYRSHNGNYLFYHEDLGNWQISDSLGSDSSDAWAPDNGETYPNEELEWQVWSNNRWRSDRDLTSECLFESLDSTASDHRPTPSGSDDATQDTDTDTDTDTDMDTDTDCADSRRYREDCRGWAADGECDTNPDFMEEECCASCLDVSQTVDTPDSSDGGDGRGGDSSDDVSDDSSPDASCEDDAMWEDNCRNWAQMGECSDNREFMLHNCAQSCDACDETTALAKSSPSSGIFEDLWDVVVSAAEDTIDIFVEYAVNGVRKVIHLIEVTVEWVRNAWNIVWDAVSFADCSGLTDLIASFLYVIGGKSTGEMHMLRNAPRIYLGYNLQTTKILSSGATEMAVDEMLDFFEALLDFFGGLSSDTNHCTMAPEFNFGHCCEDHDECYTEGCTDSDKRECDSELKRCIDDAGHEKLADLYYCGVDNFGDRFFEGYGCPQGTCLTDLTGIWLDECANVNIQITQSGSTATATSGEGWSPARGELVGCSLRFRSGFTLNGDVVGHSIIWGNDCEWSLLSDSGSAIFIGDITAVTGSSSNSAASKCPSDWFRHTLDLNRNAGGDFVYLCYEITSSQSSALRYLEIISGGSSGVSCSRGNKVNVDLNRGAGGDFVYLCVDRTASDTFVTDVTVINGGNSGITCPGGFSKDSTDINRGAGGDFIYLCTQYLHGEISTVTTTVITTVTTSSEECIAGEYDDICDSRSNIVITQSGSSLVITGDRPWSPAAGNIDGDDVRITEGFVMDGTLSGGGSRITFPNNCYWTLIQDASC